MATRTYGIVFSGGGALGAWEVGCYDAIRSRHGGEGPCVVTGASAGALNAVGVCAGMQAAQLKDFWSRIDNEDVYRPRIGAWKVAAMCASMPRKGMKGAVLDFLGGRQSIFDNEPLRKTLRDRLQSYVNPFVQSNVRLAISVTNLTQRKREFFYKLPTGETLQEPQGSQGTWTKIEGLDLLIDALVGSTALPILFAPCSHYFDGGVLLNQPISPALHLNVVPDVLYVVIPSSERLGRTTNIVDLANTLLTVWLRMSLDEQVARIKQVNRAWQSTNDPRPQIRLCVIRPDQDLTEHFGVSILSFGRRVDDLISDGYNAANNKLNRFKYDDPSTWY